MKTRLVASLAAGAALFAGCVVQCLQPLFTEADSIEYPAIVGQWQQLDAGKEVARWTFARHGDHYRLSHVDSKGHTGIFKVVAGKIGTNVFLDCTPDDPLPGGELNDIVSGHLIPAHIFARVIRTNSAILLVAMNVEWLDKHLEANPKAIPHTRLDQRPILTGSTEELKAFVGRHANDSRAFKNTVELIPLALGR